MGYVLLPLAHPIIYAIGVFIILAAGQWMIRSLKKYAGATDTIGMIAGVMIFAGLWWILAPVAVVTIAIGIL